MKVGIDVDNTILDYSKAFAREGKKLVGLQQVQHRSKAEIQSSILEAHGNTVWTEVQGRVYSLAPLDVSVFPGFRTFLRLSSERKWSISLISHKSKTPVLGPPKNLRQPIVELLTTEGILGKEESPISLKFLDTKEQKIEAVLANPLDFFIDDLLEITNSVSQHCTPIHFGCFCEEAGENRHKGFRNWPSIVRFFEKIN